MRLNALFVLIVVCIMFLLTIFIGTKLIDSRREVEKSVTINDQCIQNNEYLLEQLSIATSKLKIAVAQRDRAVKVLKDVFNDESIKQILGGENGEDHSDSE